MQTDPISAAVHYRQALEAVLDAETRQEARKLAASALAVGFTKPGAESIHVASGAGQHGPFVTISQSTRTVQISAAQARAHAMSVLAAADAAESDSFLVNWLRESMNLDPGQLAAVLTDFRAWREQQQAE